MTIKRNGVTTLFAALVAAKAKSVTQMQAGEVIGECMPRQPGGTPIQHLSNGPPRADVILEKTARARQVFEHSNSGTK
jgi:hypothetical protein